MTYEIRYLIRAQRDIKRASDWWLAHRDRAPNAFAEDLEEAERRVTTEPGIGVPIRDAIRPDTRRLLLRKTGFYLYYRVVDQTVIVLVPWHSSRKPPRSL